MFRARNAVSVYFLPNIDERRFPRTDVLLQYHRVFTAGFYRDLQFELLLAFVPKSARQIESGKRERKRENGHGFPSPADDSSFPNENAFLAGKDEAGGGGEENLEFPNCRFLSNFPARLVHVNFGGRGMGKGP